MANNRRGLASADESTRQRVASQGGKAAHEKGSAHEWNSNEARQAGAKGGERTSKSRGGAFYSQIGRKGGQSQSRGSNSGNFANDRGKASKAGKMGGKK